ncbi:MAG TPA: polysaccharide biosynthesis/export family protein [Aestuariivirgaceae bacterium]
MPTALPRGTSTEGMVKTLPVRNADGVQPPFGSSGLATAYEFGAGYKIGAGDRISIKVLGQPDLSAEHLVDGSGTIIMPLAGAVSVAGLTPQQVSALIDTKLQDGYLREPNVAVQVLNLRPFFILGEVNHAGSYAYQPGMSVQSAIAIGGGYTGRANHDDVLVTRKSAEGTRTVKAPVTAQLFPGDIVYVRERWF